MSDLQSPIPAAEFERPIEVFVVRPYRPRYWLHILLLAVTFFTMLVVGSRMQFNFMNGAPIFTTGDEFIPSFPIRWALAVPSRLLLGLPFALSLIFILLAHEMGHYVYCRKNGVIATLPFFLPAPTLIGTLGAVIRIKSPIRTRAALFDIGIAGPIAGFVAAVGTLLIAFTLSRPFAPNVSSNNFSLGYPLIFHFAHKVVGLLGAGNFPLNRMNLHPIGVAAWVGMFATALNLLPSGQLDGGHIVYALWPKAHRHVSVLLIGTLIYLGMYYPGWWVWAFLVTGMNILTWRQDQAPDHPALPRSRFILAAVGLMLLVLTFTVVPFSGSDIQWH